MTMKFFSTLLLTAISVVALVPASAQQHHQGPDHQPPQEAISACQGQEAGASVSFISPRGDRLKAVCEKHQKRLVAVPEGHADRAHRPAGANPDNQQGDQ